ncbi:AfsR/SARP family transcriptional regulator [Spirillospora sp. NPDC047418]|jgi:DNA-binding SARP family transcriptional activator
MTLFFTLLGPVGVTAHGDPVRVDRPRRRAILAYLLLHADRVVSVGRLIEATWGATPPSTAKAQIQSEIWALRRTLQPAGTAGPIATRPGGYVLEVAPGHLDLAAYTEQAAQARAESDRSHPQFARKLMREALSLWKGPALSGIAADFAESGRSRLEERRLTDVEWLADLELGLGGHHALVPELAQHVADHPLRERLRAQLMVALYRSGRQAEALAAAQRGRAILRDEYGLDPGLPLRRLEQAILRQDPVLDLS